jgi:hypothetical protein
MTPRILLYDIETSPHQGYVWGAYEQTVLHFTKHREILTVAYKWLGDKKVTVLTRADFKDKTDRSLVKAVHSLLDEADVVVGHNSIQFDNKVAHARFIFHKLPPPSPFRNFDTKRVAKSVFQFTTNKLDDLGKFLGFGGKIVTPGISLWLRAMEGDKAALKEMGEYNGRDVELLEQVYLALRPYSRGPGLSNLSHKDACPKCGKESLIKKGLAATATSTYQRFKCTSCGGWSRGRDNYQVSKIGKIKAVGT